MYKLEDSSIYGFQVQKEVVKITSNIKQWDLYHR